MTEIVPDDTTRLLLVEGSDDKQFFKRLLSQMRKTNALTSNLSRYKIRKFRGKDKLSEYLIEVIQTPNFKYLDKIWIVRDADYNMTESEQAMGAPRRVLQSVNTAISNAYSKSSRDLTPPELQDFMLPTDRRPSFSLMVLPNSDVSAEGSLETILLKALADDPMLGCVDEYFECVKQRHAESEVARNREDKNRLNVLLSGKLVLRDMARSKDTTRELPRFMYNMKWWNDDTFNDPMFTKAKTFLTQLLAD